MDNSEYERAIAELVALFAEELNIEVRSKKTDLSGVIDSQRLGELLLVIEQKVAVQILVEDFQFDNFRSIAKNRLTDSPPQEHQ